MPLAPPPPPLRVSTRPLLPIAVALAVGIGIAEARPELPMGAWAGLSAFAGASVGLYAAATRKRLVTLTPLALSVAALCAAVALGAMRRLDEQTVPPDGVARLAAADSREERTETTLWGTVVDVPERTWAIRMTVEVDSAARGASRRPTRGRVQVSLLDPDGRAVYPVLQPGDRVRLTGHLEPLPRRRNPAQMDYGAYLRRQGVGALLTVEDETGAAFLAQSPRLSIRAAQAVRDRVRESLARDVRTPQARALLHALLLADRSTIEQTTLETFRETGLMHLLAVSGLHVGLVGLALYALLKPLLGRLRWPRRRVEWVRSALTLAILALYVVVAGASVSVVRAFVMVGVLLVGRTTERRVDTLSALALAALGLLVWRPASLFDVGFQLSFGAVAALVTLTPLLHTAVPDRVRQSAVGAFAVGSVTTSLAATLGTAPALLAHFGRLPLGGLVLNLPAIPLTAVTLGAGLGAIVTSGSPPMAGAFGAVADLSARLLLWITEQGAARLGWAVYDGWLDAPSTLAAVVLGLLALAVWRRPVARRRMALAGAASLAVGSWLGVSDGDHRPAMDVVFLDVGQGDATLVTTPAGRTLLVDAGLRSPYVDEGTRTLLPHLRRYGISRIDALVLTHADADHIGGAASLLRTVPVGRLVVNGADGESDLWRDVMATADSLAVPVQTVTSGDTLSLDPAIRCRVLGPSGPMPSSNDASIALRLEHGRTRWLLTGDAEGAGETALLARFDAALAADVVKVGHHGSRTSSTPRFVAATGRPQWAVVSVARRNRYGLPDEEPLARWVATGATVVQTKDEGAIWLRSDGEHVRRIDWR